jgi:tetratricopeptide (TPR) repeat protein
MLQKKKKLSKKEIKEDKLVSFVNKSANFFEEYKNKIFTYGVIAVIAIAAVYFYINQKNVDNQEAATELSRVMKLYDQGSYLEAIEGKQGTNIIGLKKIVDEYGGTENGETAKIYLANSYAFLGNYDDAIIYYEDYDGSIDYLKAAALAGEAGYYAAKGDFEKAADMYLSASKISKINANNPTYLLNAGINYQKSGLNDEAKAIFNQIKEDFAKSTVAKDVNKYIVNY